MQKNKTYKSKRIIVLLFMLAVSHFTFGQTTIVVDKQGVTCGVNYSGSPEHSSTDYFIREVTRDNLKGLDNTRFYFSATTNPYSEKLNDSLFLLNFSLQNPIFTGDASYRDVNISSILLPPNIQSEWIIEDASGKTTLRHISLVLDNDRKNYLASVSYNGNPINLSLKNIKFGYNSESIEKFDSFLGKINDYYAANQILDYVSDSLEVLRSSGCDKLSSVIPILMLSEKVLYDFDSINFIQLLNLKNYDPLKLAEKYNQVNIKHRHVYSLALRNVDSYRISSISELLLQTVENFTENLVFLLDKSSGIAPTLAPYYYNTVLVDYAWLKTTNAVAVLDACADANGAAGLNITSALGIELRTEYFKQGEIFTNETKYSEATVMFENAKSICLTLGFSDVLAVDNALAKAKYGVYFSYIKVARQSLNVGNFDLAERFIKLAEAFQKNNTAYILNNKSTAEIKELLVIRFIREAEILNDNKAFIEADIILNRAEKLTNDLSHLSLAKGLEVELIRCRQGVYSDCLKESMTYYRKSIPDSAILKLDNARDYRFKNQDIISKSNEEDELSALLAYLTYFSFDEVVFNNENKLFSTNDTIINWDYDIKSHNYDETSSMKNVVSTYMSDYVIDIVNEAYTCVEEDDNKCARNNLIKARKALYDFNITDSLIIVMVERLQISLVQAKCIEENQNLAVILNKIDKSIFSKDYIQLGTQLDSAELIIRKMPYCFDKEELYISSLYARFRPAIEYNNLMKAVDVVYSNRDYPLVIDMISGLSSKYPFSLLLQFNIDKLTVADYVKKKANNGFTISAIKRLIKRNKYLEAYRLLDQLPKNDVWIKYTAELQEELGITMAGYDIIRKKDSNPEDILLAYTHGDEFYKHFRKGYIRGWENQIANK